tara:strand:+ start:293 stop:622 length:330 start_codon:yes stop_codon:yes gene_type:complete
MRVILFLILFLLLPITANTQGGGLIRPIPCSTTDEMLLILKTSNEKPISFGQTNDEDRHVVIYRKEDRTTWTIVEHFPDGRSCLLSNGKNWQFINPFNLRILPPLGDEI